MSALDKWDYEATHMPGIVVARSGVITMKTTGKRYPRYIIERRGRVLREVNGEMKHAKRAFERLTRRLR